MGEGLKIRQRRGRSRRLWARGGGQARGGGGTGRPLYMSSDAERGATMSRPRPAADEFKKRHGDRGLWDSAGTARLERSIDRGGAARECRRHRERERERERAAQQRHMAPRARSPISAARRHISGLAGGRAGTQPKRKRACRCPAWLSGVADGNHAGSRNPPAATRRRASTCRRGGCRSIGPLSGGRRQRGQRGPARAWHSGEPRGQPP